MVTLITFFSGVLKAMLMWKIVRLAIVLPVIYIVTDYIETSIFSLLSDVVIPAQILSIMSYFYIDRALSIIFSFWQLKGLLKFAKIWLKVL